MGIFVRKLYSNPLPGFLLAVGIATGLSGCSRSTALAAEATARPSLFSSSYPASKSFRREVDQMILSGRLRSENHQQIEREAKRFASQLQIPESLLWCLFFQESRLNHLAGFSSPTGARGLGQFNTFGFVEVNNQLDNYTLANRRAMVHAFHKSILPIHTHVAHFNHPSSYYTIPTAVFASAAFLNNRYLQLDRALQKREITYHPDLLWLQAALAYNKGGRSVYSLWNHLRRQKNHSLEDSLRNPDTLFDALENPRTLKRSLRRVWPDQRSELYANEWMTHWKNLRACSMTEDAG